MTAASHAEALTLLRATRRLVAAAQADRDLARAALYPPPRLLAGGGQ